VVFEGPWTDLSIRPDIEAAAGARLDAERERLKERAREKLGEELGVAPAEGQSTEDVIKKEIGDRLLRKLFD
jgi:AsmA protein